MEKNRSRRLKVWLPFGAAAVMVLGMILGIRLNESLGNKRNISYVIERNDRLEQLIDLISQNYVDSVNTNTLYRNAVNGILSPLDPHTVYIPASEVQAANEDLEGSFFGIGIEYAILQDTILVTYVIPKGPSEKAGLRAGDQILSVEDTVVAGIGINSAKIVKMLRGRQKSEVTIGVKRVGSGIREMVSIVRDEVPIASVDADLLLEKNTGYIKINRFSATTYSEFAKALKGLLKKGATSLILDLRGNPGGYLEAARNIADEFLDDEKLIVYTKALHEKSEKYTAFNRGMFEDGRLAILVDESTASAGEILAGAVQDWDRGAIIGRRTFGKGLVQEQFDLEDGSALRLTVARYYTPSGRSIQRSFKQGRQAYEEAFEERFKSGELLGKDSLYQEEKQEYYSLTQHRPLYGGGGIKPDYFVPYDSGRLTSGLISLLVSDKLQEAIWDYYSDQLSELKDYSGIHDFLARFVGQNTILNSYLGRMTPSEKKMALLVLKRKENKEYLLLQIRSQMGRILFQNNGYYSVNTKNDELVIKALEILHSQAYSRLIGR